MPSRSVFSSIEPDLSRAARGTVDENGVVLYHENIDPGLNGFWVEAKDLREGDVFLGANGELLTLVSQERVEFEESITVYNFTVDGNHNYFVIAADDVYGQTCVLVHNAESYEGEDPNQGDGSADPLQPHRFFNAPFDPNNIFNKPPAKKNDWWFNQWDDPNATPPERPPWQSLFHILTDESILKDWANWATWEYGPKTLISEVQKFFNNQLNDPRANNNPGVPPDDQPMKIFGIPLELRLFNIRH